MKNIFLFLCVVVLFTSCKTHERWLLENKDKACAICPEKVTVIHDSIAVHTEKDSLLSIDTLYSPMEVDIMLFNALVKCDSLNKAQMDSVKVTTTHGSTAIIYVHDGQLTADIECHEDSLRTIIKVYQKTIKDIIRINDELSQVKDRIIIQKPGQFYVWFFWIEMILLLLYGILRFRKFINQRK
jgi:hypothetical protein